MDDKWIHHKTPDIKQQSKHKGFSGRIGDKEGPDRSVCQRSPDDSQEIRKYGICCDFVFVLQSWNVFCSIVTLTSIVYYSNIPRNPSCFIWDWPQIVSWGVFFRIMVDFIIQITFGQPVNRFCRNALPVDMCLSYVTVQSSWHRQSGDHFLHVAEIAAT